MTNDPSGTKVEGKTGVGGFLIVFCIILIFGVPFLSIYTLVNDLQIASTEFEYVPGLKAYLVLYTAIRAVLIVFSILAGASLLSEWHGAVWLVKAYLLTFLFCLLLGISMLFLLVDFSPEDYEFLVYKLGVETVSSLIFFAFCYGYISISKRVKRTFPDAFPKK
ncbi:MAG: DUF2569 family protein [Candidatus Hydrogenedentes bacterium]|nr:DUF2569 family protein [Candidatus Hydrogenedentota bacterium]